MKMDLRELVERIEREILPGAMFFVGNSENATICDGETMISFYSEEGIEAIKCRILYDIYQKEFTVYHKTNPLFGESKILKDMNNDEIFNIISNNVNGMKENELDEETIDEIDNTLNIILDNVKDVASNKEYIWEADEEQGWVEETVKFIDEFYIKSVDDIEIENKDHMYYNEKDGSCYNSIKAWNGDDLLKFILYRNINGKYTLEVKQGLLKFDDLGTYNISNKNSINKAVNRSFDKMFENLVESCRH